MLVGFYVVNQQRYIENWEYQKSFLRALPSVVPELNGSKLVVVKGVNIENVKREEVAFDWSLPYLPGLFWNLPHHWNGGPTLVGSDMFEQFGFVSDGVVSIKGYPTIGTKRFYASDVLVVEFENKVGTLAPVVKLLGSNRIHIHYAYGSSGDGFKIVGIFSTSDNEKARDLINEESGALGA